MIIYIAGPYSSDDPLEVDENVRVAIDAGIEVFRRGHTPVIPHLSHFIELLNEDHSIRHGIRLSYEDYMRMDQDYIKVCDALLFLGPSPGSLSERLLAYRHGKIVYYRTDEIPFGEHVTESRRNQSVVKTWERRYS